MSSLVQTTLELGKEVLVTQKKSCTPLVGESRGGYSWGGGWSPPLPPPMTITITIYPFD